LLVLVWSSTILRANSLTAACVDFSCIRLLDATSNMSLFATLFANCSAVSAAAGSVSAASAAIVASDFTISSPVQDRLKILPQINSEPEFKFRKNQFTNEIMLHKAGTALSPSGFCIVPLPPMELAVASPALVG